MAKPRSGRPRDPEVDLRIVHAAREALRNGGMSSLSIAGVATAAGVSRPAIYRRYTNADDLARAVVYADLDVIVAAAMAEPASSGDLAHRLACRARHFYTYYQAHPDLSRSFLRLILVPEPGPWADRFNVQVAHYLGALVGDVQGGVQRGEISEDANPMLITQAFFALYLTVAMAGLNGVIGTVDDQQALLEALLRQHLTGL
jgi:AcrR family transcriptional regulator